MRDHPFAPASEQPRPFSEVLAERRALDPACRARDLADRRIEQLEADAASSEDAGERKRLQCAAEDLRAAITENAR